MSATFACTECARCCNHLLETKAKTLPENAAALAEAGLHALPRTGGLQAWAWEAEAMRRAAARRGHDIPFEPALAVALRIGEATRLATLVYEMTRNACPLVEGTRCGAYEERPVICRAYPLLLQGRTVVVSTLCPGHVDAPLALLPASYGPAYRAVELAYHLPGFVARQLAFLETAGALRIVRHLAPADAQGLPRADLLDVLDEVGHRERFLAEARAFAEGIERS